MALLGLCLQIVLHEPPIGEGGFYDADCKDLRPALEWSLEKGWLVPLSQVILNNSVPEKVCKYWELTQENIDRYPPFRIMIGILQELLKILYKY
jgi:hypothetical protein